MFDICQETTYSCSVVVERREDYRTQHQSRLGRRPVVVASLEDLRGPTEGAVDLPIWLYWSSPDHTFSLADLDMRRWLYQIVLREAGRPEDLIAHLDADMLIALWPDLFLPRGVRWAWENQHSCLRFRRPQLPDVDRRVGSSVIAQSSFYPCLGGPGSLIVTPTG